MLTTQKRFIATFINAQVSQQVDEGLHPDVIFSNARETLNQSYMDEMQDIAENENITISDVIDEIMEDVLDFYETYYN